MGAEPMTEQSPPIQEPLAERVRRGDPDRFAAVMIAPEGVRPALITLYAFNLEIARTPWRVSEPQIGAIRLRWWLDALGEIYDGKPVRAHEITTPLAALIHAFPPGAAPPRAVFESMVEARARDLDPAPLADGEELNNYLEATSGGLTRLAAWILTRGDESPAQAAAARDAGYAFGAANLLRATPELAARGRMMLSPTPEAGQSRTASATDISAALNALARGEVTDGLRRAANRLARHALDRLALARARRDDISTAAAPAFLAGWRAEAALRTALRPDVDLLRELGPESEFRRRMSLLWRASSGRW